MALHNDKRPIIQEDIAIINVDINKSVSRYMRLKWKKLKGKINKFNIIFGDVDTCLAIID